MSTRRPAEPASTPLDARSTEPMAAVTSTTTARRTAAWLAASLTLGALTLSACAAAGSPSSTTTTSTLPPLPPTVLAYVALAGAGNNFGFGHFLQRVDL